MTRWVNRAISFLVTRTSHHSHLSTPPTHAKPSKRRLSPTIDKSPFPRNHEWENHRTIVYACRRSFCSAICCDADISPKPCSTACRNHHHTFEDLKIVAREADWMYFSLEDVQGPPRAKSSSCRARWARDPMGELSAYTAKPLSSVDPVDY